jgi:hypothetical protein
VIPEVQLQDHQHGQRINQNLLQHGSRQHIQVRRGILTQEATAHLREVQAPQQGVLPARSPEAHQVRAPALAEAQAEEAAPQEAPHQEAVVKDFGDD